MSQDAQMVHELLLALPDQLGRPSGQELGALLDALVKNDFDLRKSLAEIPNVD